MLWWIRFLLFNVCVSERYRIHVKKSWITGKYIVTMRDEIVITGVKRTYYRKLVELDNYQVLLDYLQKIWKVYI